MIYTDSVRTFIELKGKEMKIMGLSGAKNDWQLTVYIPRELRHDDPISQLKRLAKEQRRSINFLAVEAIRQYLCERQKQDQLQETVGSR